MTPFNVTVKVGSQAATAAGFAGLDFAFSDGDFVSTSRPRRLNTDEADIDF